MRGSTFCSSVVPESKMSAAINREPFSSSTRRSISAVAPSSFVLGRL